MLESVDPSLRLAIAGVAAAVTVLLSTANAKALADGDAVFDGMLTLLQRVYPSPRPTEYWVSTCAEIDATSVWLGAVMQGFG